MSASWLRGVPRTVLIWVGAVGLFATGCDSAPTSDSEPRRTAYALAATANDGALPDGVSGTVTFWELPAQQTLITVTLDNGATGLEAVHPVGLYRGPAGEDGNLALRITAVEGKTAEGLAGAGSGARVINAPYTEFTAFDGHVRIGQSVEADSVVVAAGNIGSLAEGTPGPGLDLVPEPRDAIDPLRARSNDGPTAPDGVPGDVQIVELTPDQTVLLVRLGLAASTGANTGHPVRLHRNSVSEGGPVAFVLTPINGQDPVPGGASLIPLPFDSLATFNGHLRISDRPTALDVVFSSGNVGDE